MAPKKTTKRKKASKKKTSVLDKVKNNSLSLTLKDFIAVLSTIVALSLSVVTILGWKFVTNEDYNVLKQEISIDKLDSARQIENVSNDVKDKVFELRYQNVEVDKSIEILKNEDTHIKGKMQEIVDRQENTDRKVERIDKNIVILLERNRLQPAPEPKLKPMLNYDDNAMVGD